MPDFSPTVVEERLRKAIGLRAILSACDSNLGPTVRGIGTIGGIGVGARDIVVDEASEALCWLRWLDPNDAGILAARLAGVAWKSICWRFGISRPTADRRFRYSLALIAWRLNGHARSDRTPSLRSLLGMRHSA